MRPVRSEQDHIRTAVAALEDDLAQQISDCEETLKFERDIQKRRVAETRFLRLTDQTGRAA